jgi:hypothetical protein
VSGISIVVIALLQKKRPPFFGGLRGWIRDGLRGYHVQRHEGLDIEAIAMDMDIAKRVMRRRP